MDEVDDGVNEVGDGVDEVWVISLPTKSRQIVSINQTTTYINSDISSLSYCTFL